MRKAKQKTPDPVEVVLQTVDYNPKTDRIEPVGPPGMTEREIVAYNKQIATGKPFLPMHIRGRRNQ